jgi:hypothetical protein
MLRCYGVQRFEDIMGESAEPAVEYTAHTARTPGEGFAGVHPLPDWNTIIWRLYSKLVCIYWKII